MLSDPARALVDLAAVASAATSAREASVMLLPDLPAVDGTHRQCPARAIAGSTVLELFPSDAPGDVLYVGRRERARLVLTDCLPEQATDQSRGRDVLIRSTPA